jgi:hypothetical protein
VLLAAASARVSETHDVRPIPLADDVVAEALTLARRGLDPPALAARARGQALPLDEAIAEAVALDAAPLGRLGAPPNAEPLRRVRLRGSGG